jgi:hypothetical protein
MARFRSIRTLFIVAGIVLLIGGTIPVNADCDFYCMQGYDWADCWEMSPGNMASCYVVCDCMGWSCACWCRGSNCYWT